MITAKISIVGAAAVAEYLSRTIPTACPRQNIKDWEEVRDALHAIASEADAIITDDAFAGIIDANTPSSIFTFLDLSTAHVSPEARRWLEAQALAGAVERGPSHTVAAYREGWWVYVPSLEGGPTSWKEIVPTELHPIIEAAQKMGCYYVRFDADGDADERFHTFEDDEDTLDGFPPEARAAIEAARAHPEDAGIADELAEPGELNMDVQHYTTEKMQEAAQRLAADLVATGAFDGPIPAHYTPLAERMAEPVMPDDVMTVTAKGLAAVAARSGKEVVDAADFKELIEAAKIVVVQGQDFGIVKGGGVGIRRLSIAIDAVT